jgi:hypothetical protein
MAEQLIDVREAKLIDYPRLGAVRHAAVDFDKRFPVKQGKNREFHPFRLFLGGKRVGKALKELAFFRNSLQTGTGNCFRLIRELPIAIKEFP